MKSSWVKQCTIFSKVNFNRSFSDRIFFVYNRFFKTKQLQFVGRSYQRHIFRVLCIPGVTVSQVGASLPNIGLLGRERCVISFLASSIRIGSQKAHFLSSLHPWLDSDRQVPLYQILHDFLSSCVYLNWLPNVSSRFHALGGYSVDQPFRKVEPINVSGVSDDIILSQMDEQCILLRS